MKQNKALFVLNIIIFVILIACLLFDVFIVANVIEAKHALENAPEDGFDVGLGLAVLLVLQIYLAIPYAVCLIISIVSMCCKYFNWLSIANAVMCGVAVILTVAVFLIV